MTQVKTQVMFQGDAEDAVDLYTSVFIGFKVDRIERYGAAGAS